VEIMTWPLIQSGFVLGNVMLLWSGGIRVIQGEISLGMLVEFQQYLMILQWPALSVAWTMSLVLRGRASLTRLQDVLAEEPPVYGGTQLTDPSKAEVQPIVFDQVSLSLEGRPVLHDVSFRVEPGQMLGITGPTGSGKTLLLQMVLRRQDPDAGRIWFGDTDIREMPVETLYRIFRIAAQEPVLFSMSLRENLLLADAEVSEEALQQALYLSALQHDLEQLPDGLETKIGERGVTLSGGQRQRSAIARALISDPPVLMLDDSLSAVDTSTESRILERLLPAVRGRTLMMVSHRYAALRHCDQVLVLREGRVEQAGRPSDLLAQGGYFAELELRQRLQAQLEEGE
jgi:ATP-binding cassette subfamily B protein